MNAFKNSLGSLTLLLTGFVLCQCAKEEAPPVGVLKTTTHEFTLHVGPEGTLYTVRDGSGKVIAKEVSGAVLAAEFPKLSEDLKGLYAGNKILESKFRIPSPDRFDSPQWETKEVESIDLPPTTDLKTRSR